MNEIYLKPIHRIIPLPRWKYKAEIKKKQNVKRSNYMFKSTNKVDIYV